MVRNVCKFTLYSALLLTFITGSNVWAFDKLTATVDKNPAMLDESITLTLEANAALPRDAFDTSVLEKDFKVVRTSVSNQMRKINLRESVSTTWTTILFPRTTGRLRVPAINIHSIQSAPIDILVVPVSQASAQTRDIFMSAEVLPEQGYVQQQLTYQVKLFLAVELERGSLQVPSVDNVMMEQMGEDLETTAIQNGKRYRVIERNFSIIPQESGALRIPSPIFEGSIRTRNRGSFGGLFNPSKAVNQIGPEVTIDIKPIPQDYNEAWLPSEFVQINEAWSADLSNFTVGEPITRTITLSAIGVDDSVLPAIDDRLPPSIKAYPDQPQLNTVNKDNTLIAQKVTNMALVPSREGNFVLPEIKVPWFNTLTQTTEYAIIPAQAILVQPAVLTSSSAINSAQNNLSNNATLPVPVQVSDWAERPWYQQALPWQISTLLVLVLWGCSIWFAPKAIPLAKSKTSNAAKTISFNSLLQTVEKRSFKYIEQDCKQWLSQHHPQQATLYGYTQALQHVDFSDTVTAMYAYMYDNQGDELQVRAQLKLALTQLQANNKGAKPALTSLYPDN
jgi:hypothetical protein